jgi:hypothetical protein
MSSPQKTTTWLMNGTISVPQTDGSVITGTATATASTALPKLSQSEYQTLTLNTVSALLAAVPNSQLLNGGKLKSQFAVQFATDGNEVST